MTDDATEHALRRRADLQQARQIGRALRTLALTALIAALSAAVQTIHGG